MEIPTIVWVALAVGVLAILAVFALRGRARDQQMEQRGASPREQDDDKVARDRKERLDARSRETAAKWASRKGWTP